MPQMVYVAFALIVIASGIAFLNWALARIAPHHVRAVWYLFSLALIVTLLIGTHARQIETIDTNGDFHGAYGEILKKGLEVMFDFNSDFLFLGAIATVVIVPQLTSYVMSGISGCASAPLYTGKSMIFCVWSGIKSLATGAGVLLALALLGALGLFHVGSSSKAAATALFLLMISFALLWAFDESQSGFKELAKHQGPASTWLRKMHAFFTRNHQVEPTD